jgi:hypothetical protein
MAHVMIFAFAAIVAALTVREMISFFKEVSE